MTLHGWKVRKMEAKDDRGYVETLNTVDPGSLAMSNCLLSVIIAF